MTLPRRLLPAAALALGLTLPAAAQAPDPTDWEAVLAQAEGKTVHWHAWGGSMRINDYIAWAAEQVEARYSVRVEHVKLSDTAEAVSRVIAEKAAGRNEDGAVDLIWINGENFAALKSQGLLFGPWAEQLPNWRYIDAEANPAVRFDFTVLTEGYEAPWSMARLVLYHDSVRLPDPPRSIPALLDWAQANPGRFTYPQPPDFLGSTFLKQALHALTDDPTVLTRPVSEVDYLAATAPLWEYLEALTPNLWREGRAYPQSGPRQVQLMADGEIDLALTFDPNEPASAVMDQELPGTVRAYALDAGGIGNASFVAIPYNSGAKAAAMVLANFLMSPEAQTRKLDPQHWGAGTVLALERLPKGARARFEAIETGPAGISPADLGPTLPEPHPSWMTRLEEDWIARFGVGK